MTGASRSEVPAGAGRKRNQAQNSTEATPKATNRPIVVRTGVGFDSSRKPFAGLRMTSQ